MTHNIKHNDFKSACGFLLLLFFALPSSAYSETAEEEKKVQREAMLKLMKQKIEGTKVSLLSDGQEVKADLIARPIFRYSDSARFILDATLWAWTKNGRPVAVCKMEGMRGFAAAPDKPRWLYNLSSFSSDGLVEAEWNFGHRWTARKSPLRLVELSDGPKPSKSKNGRMIQLKKIARRFTSTMYITPTKQQLEMRLLPTPVYRYSHPESGLRDAAIFGLASYGTNPDALFAIELQDEKGSPSVWKYGVVGMTQGALSVRLDGEQVWTKPWTDDRGSLETWTWFFEARVKKSK